MAASIFTLFDILAMFAIIIIETQKAADRRLAHKLVKTYSEITACFADRAVISVFWSNLFQGYNQEKKLLLYNLQSQETITYPYHPLLSVFRFCRFTYSEGHSPSVGGLTAYRYGSTFAFIYNNRKI